MIKFMSYSSVKINSKQNKNLKEKIYIKDKLTLY